MRARPGTRTGTERLDIGALARGVYLVRLEAGNRTVTRKLVIQ